MHHVLIVPLVCAEETHKRREDFIARAQAAGVDAAAVPHAADAVRLVEAVNVERIPGFASGAVSVTDDLRGRRSNRERQVFVLIGVVEERRKSRNSSG